MYKSKYKITSDESFKGYEKAKIFNGIKKEVDNQFFWKILPFALLVAFSILAIVVMVSNGG